MAPLAAHPHLGGPGLFSPLAKPVGRRPRQLVRPVGRRALGPAPFGPGTNRLLLLLHLGGPYPAEPLPGGAPPAPRLRPGLPAHRGGDANSARGRSTAPAQAG